jgi:hypothetical protein
LYGERHQLIIKINPHIFFVSTFTFHICDCFVSASTSTTISLRALGPDSLRNTLLRIRSRTHTHLSVAQARARTYARRRSRAVGHPAVSALSSPPSNQYSLYSFHQPCIHASALTLSLPSNQYSLYSFHHPCTATVQQKETHQINSTSFHAYKNDALNFFASRLNLLRSHLFLR